MSYTQGYRWVCLDSGCALAVLHCVLIRSKEFMPFSWMFMVNCLCFKEHVNLEVTLRLSRIHPFSWISFISYLHYVVSNRK